MFLYLVVLMFIPTTNIFSDQFITPSHLVSDAVK